MTSTDRAQLGIAFTAIHARLEKAREEYDAFVKIHGTTKLSAKLQARYVDLKDSLDYSQGQCAGFQDAAKALGVRIIWGQHGLWKAVER